MRGDPGVSVFKQSWIACLCLVLAQSAAGITIDDSTSALNDRFANDPSFIMANYDLSGVGRSSDGRWATLVSRNVFVSANHFRPGSNSSITFFATNDPTGASVTRSVATAQRIDNSDIWIGKLDNPVPLGYASYDFATENIGSSRQFNRSVYQGENAFVFGQSPNFSGLQDVAVGRNVLDRWFSSVDAAGTIDSAIAADVESESQDVTYEAFLQGGDSGGPLFVDFNEGDSNYDLRLVGTNWFVAQVGNPAVDVNGFAYLGNYDQQIQAFIDGSPIPGDLDGDGDVDNADIGTAVGNFTGAGGSTSMTFADGDMDGDGDIDNADLGVIVGAFTGAMANLSSASVSEPSVPEPGSILLLGMGGLALLRRRR